ncbi:kunitz-type protease inhibitor 3 precursor [Homo sapiens]|uniref:Kunitz-type protease inhibitor 3 n=1 Tax=Homo sapiens TaxID=9606 RepID=SPIT3_HUMAN|nr:kunitz-type protease inhibitor 3 precursor [Homo sapiens]P49223.3 RecName: Full=Kunitz-type protease inhibitor 3; AltName: Full=HKIB9; Flags: Precursor [Homo sapiens]AAR17081.2 serine protease inhibitor Kunitz type 3 [Homo sapiens]|eukprot:NP_006643.1 kunitz-type protease inhibitor 3 precursor [Homo sapiens]
MQLQASLSFLLILTLCLELRSELARDTIKDLLPNVCAFPMEKGPCQTYMTRWFFNFETGECELFAYGGCGGNSNNFLRKEKCEKFCKFT